MNLLPILLLSCLVLCLLLWRINQRRPPTHRRRGKQRHVSENSACTRASPGTPTRFQPKPAWVRREIIRLSALMPHDGGQKIANTFNRLHVKERRMTVGKTWVCEQRKKHRYAILKLRREIKHRTPRSLPIHHIWAMDITGLPDQNRQSYKVLGVIDHGSRALLSLSKIHTKTSTALLRVLLDNIEHTGHCPHYLRTDNEAIFTSKLFRFGLWWLGIRQQRIDKGCPWQNGRIERLFGTLKQKAHGLLFQDDQMQEQLNLFRFWHNHIRTHQHLDGRTPFEVYQKNQKTYLRESHPEPRWFDAWNGRLAGYWFRPG